MAAFDNKRERGQNWTQEEKLFLLNQIQERIDAISCKHVDHNSLRDKLDAWKEIYDDFCQHYGPFRELQRLREMWRRMKTGARNEYRDWEKAKRKCDGSESYKIPSKISQLVHDLIPHELLVQPLIYSQSEQYPSMIGVQSTSGLGAGIQTAGSLLDHHSQAGSLDQTGQDMIGSSSNPNTPTPVTIKSEEDSYPAQAGAETENYHEEPSNDVDSDEEPTRSRLQDSIYSNGEPSHVGRPRHIWPILPSSSGSVGRTDVQQDVEQHIIKLRLREQKRKLEMMEEEHKAKMRVIRVEKHMDQMTNSNQSRQSSSTTTTAERYRRMWQQGHSNGNHHDDRIDMEKEMLKMKQEEHRRRMEVLEEQHAAKMSVLQMEKDLVTMKIEAFMKELRKDDKGKDDSEIIQDGSTNQDAQGNNDQMT